MAKYLITKPAFVENQYFFADARQPSVITLLDDTEPSVTWEPVDAAGKAALKKLAAKKGLKKDFALVTPEDAPEAVSDVVSMADIQTAKPKRASDKDAI